MTASDPTMTDPRLGTILDGRYRLDDCLAAGGMGVVYKAERVGIGKIVAIKFLHNAFAERRDLVRRFELEAKTMSRLSHPNIVSVIDHGVAGGSPYLVMEFHVGRSLGDLLCDGPLPPRRAVGLARQILAGIRHAHALGIVHRDLKPDNVLLLSGVGDEDFVKILDFGLAKLIGGEDSSQKLTTAGFALGTPGYMSPEQAQGNALDQRTDLYSLGVLLFEMVVGRKPFRATSPVVLLRMQIDDPPPKPRQAAPLAGISAELDRVILKALEKDPASRFRSAAEFAAALDATPEGSRSEVSIPTLPAQDLVPVPEAEPEILPATAAKDPSEATPQPAPKVVVVRRRGILGGLFFVLLIAAGGAAIAWATLHPESAENVRERLQEAGRVVMRHETRDGGVAPPITPRPAKTSTTSRKLAKSKLHRAKHRR